MRLIDVSEMLRHWLGTNEGWDRMAEVALSSVYGEMMTKGEACGVLLQHYIDDTVLSPVQRREVVKAIPAEARFVTLLGGGKLATLAIIQAVLDEKLMGEHG